MNYSRKKKNFYQNFERNENIVYLFHKTRYLNEGTSGTEPSLLISFPLPAPYIIACHPNIASRT
jgi:hypothetical protein